MVQKKPPRIVPPTSGLSHGIRKCAGFWIGVAEHLVDQVYAMLTGKSESIFQPQTVVTGIHTAASGVLDKFLTGNGYEDLLAIGVDQEELSPCSGTRMLLILYPQLAQTQS